MLACRVIYRTNQIAAFGYVSRTNQIAALGYVSRINHITAFGYLAPITAFRVCISHQSYHSIWMSCTDHGVWVLFSSKWCQKFCAHLISVMVEAFARASSIKVEIIGIWRFHIICIIFKLKLAFSAPLLTTYTPRPSRTMKKTSKVRSEHTHSLHYMTIRQFFTCLNCIPPIKFYFANLDFAPSRVISL